MYELEQIGKQSYYINCPAKIGIYRRNDKDVYLIDSGNDKEAGKKVLKLAAQNNWEIKAIITLVVITICNNRLTVRFSQTALKLLLLIIRFWNLLFYMADILVRS